MGIYKEVDYFAVVTLLAIVLLLVFLVVTVIYFNSTANLTPPTRAESTFLFWTGIVMIVLLTVLAVYAMIRIFYYPLLIMTPDINPNDRVVMGSDT